MDWPSLRRRISRVSCAALLVLGLGVVGVPTPASADNVVAIVNEENLVADISIHDLRLLYGLYRRAWEGGARVVLVVPEAGTPEMAFLASLVFRRHDESEVDRHFLQAVFQGRISQEPVRLSGAQAISLVSNVEGAIALVEASEVRFARGIRVLQISEVNASLSSDAVGG